MNWITIKRTRNHWEAELMQQILSAHGIPSRVVGQGIGTAYLGNGSPCVLQVHRPEQWTALLLLSPTEEDDDENDGDDDGTAT